MFLKWQLLKFTSAGQPPLSIGANETIRVTLPSYPNFYPNNADIRWIIQTELGYKIHINFLQFSTEENYDIFTAGDGNDTASSQFFKWDGTRRAPDLLSNGNEMWLRFTSNRRRVNQGFFLLASSVSSTGKYLKHSGCLCPSVFDIMNCCSDL